MLEAITQQLDLLLTLESGTYRMLRQAVPHAIQRDTDKVISIEAVEEYLKPAPQDQHQDDGNATTTHVASPEDSGQSGDAGQSSGDRHARPLNPYLQGKLQAQQETAQRAEEYRRKMQKDAAATLVSPSDLALLVSQKPSLAQRIKRSFTR